MIGCEFASFFSKVGVKVTVVEMMKNIIPMVDTEITGMLQKAMKGVTFKLGCKVERIEADKVVFSEGGKEDSVAADCVLLSIGRYCNVKGIGLEELGLDFDRRGVKVDEQMKTNLPGLYAIGDVNGKSMLAHSASRMGEVALKDINGKNDRVRYHAVPWVVYTTPEIASVGYDLEGEGKRLRRGGDQVPLRGQRQVLGRERRPARPGQGHRGQEDQSPLGSPFHRAQLQRNGFRSGCDDRNRVQGAGYPRSGISPSTVSEALKDAIWALAS